MPKSLWRAPWEGEPQSRYYSRMHLEDEHRRNQSVINRRTYEKAIGAECSNGLFLMKKEYLAYIYISCTRNIKIFVG